MTFTYIDDVKRLLVNVPGKRLKKKFVVFESDDWGGERIPSRDTLTELARSGVNIHINSFNLLDSLETENDLAALFETLMKFKDWTGNHPIITANTVTANPDFAKIGSNDFQHYFFESSLQTYKKKRGCENSFQVIKEGISRHIYHPQFHGREHLNVSHWMHALRSRDRRILTAFNAGVYSIDLEEHSYTRPNYMAAFNSQTGQEAMEHRKIVMEGISMFRKDYGFSPTSFIAPSYTWPLSLEAHLRENGIKYIQGIPIQTVPVGRGKFKKKYHFQGEKNTLNQIYFVRNCFFEPSLNSKFNWIENCIKRVKIAFMLRKPAVIGTHRVNYIGSLLETNRQTSLRDLSVLLESILKYWPDVEFTTTDKLGESY
jgi:hypothetical protein